MSSAHFRVTTVAVLVALAGTARAQNEDAVRKMIDLNKKALAAFSAKDFDSAKNSLMDAVVLGKEAGLANDEPFRQAVRSHLEFGSHVAQQNSWAETDADLHPIRNVP